MKKLFVGAVLVLFGMLSTNAYAEPTAAATSRVVVLETTQGNIEVTLMPEAAPKACENFTQLAAKGYYNNLLFHRVIKGFMIQGGDPLTKDSTQKSRWGTGGPGYQFADEINSHKLVRGVLAMANSGPNTNGSQFFIITAPATSWLDGKHTAFGRVVSVLETVDAIEGTATDASDRPVEDVVINRITAQ